MKDNFYFVLEITNSKKEWNKIIIRIFLYL